MLINRGVNYAKIFKAPNWTISAEAERAAKDMGFLVVKDHYYNWNLKDEMPKKKYNILVVHGHVQNDCGNGLEEVMPKLLKIPIGTEFMFLSEVFGADKVNSAEVLKGLAKIEGGDYERFES